MKKISKIIVFLFAITITLNLCACGRYSEPMPIKGSGYPHTYPQQQ